MSGSYVDYEHILSREFDALSFANTLVLATNDKSDRNTDLDTPRKRLTYDMEEVGQKIRQHVHDNHNLLLGRLEKLRQVQTALDPLAQGVNHVKASSDRLQRDIVVPYRNAETIAVALKRLHSTSSLLRSLTRYLQLARQLHQHQTLPPDRRSERLATSAIALIQLKECVSPSLRSLQVVKAHQHSIARIESLIREQSVSALQSHTSRTSAESTSIAAAAQALNLISPALLKTTVEDMVAAQVAQAAMSFVKAFTTSLVAFESAAFKVSDMARALNALHMILENTSTPSVHEQLPRTSTDLAVPSLWTTIQNGQGSRGLLSSFWRDVAYNLDTKFKELAIRSPALLRSNALNATQYKAVIKQCVVDGGALDPDSLEVKVMIKAVSTALHGPD